ncbi:MAG: NTP transferase domain-containing protein, partial [Gemmatimonadetes bacterium]|nr:NTP transferase domain-containing protein [Gemmatimonadota bacterium]
MKIVIPMSGLGERFARAGYTQPKALIEVDGKPMVAHVLDLFPGAGDVLFICNREHLETPGFRMREVLRRWCPHGEIAAIEPHKLGPVNAVVQVLDRIDPGEPVVVNYCDFTCYWDFAHFSRWVEEAGCDGAIPAYRGFHPHSLGSTFYAYMRERHGWVLDIQEKQPFTATPMNEFASSGTYYFARGDLVRHYFPETMRRGLTVGGEFYASLVYRPMLEDGLAVAAYEVQHFMQWGTPEDLAQYRRWSDGFRALAAGPATPPRQAGAVVVPMAGLGQRFADEGYALPKPMIPVSGRPMVVQAAADLPAADRYVFVVRSDQAGVEETIGELERSFTGVQAVRLDGVTEGQACTALIGTEGLDPELPVTIGACDNGLLFEGERFRALMEDAGADVLVWVMRGHPGALQHPRMYGWVHAGPDGRIQRVAVKEPPEDPAGTPAVVGAFTFRRAGDFARAVERMVSRDARVNGEFYVDTCINDAVALGLDCRMLEVEHYFGWGTPNDLRSFEYWQSCFSKWMSHPYALERDRPVPPETVAA